MISVIIPVYNAESTLRKCLDSILNQLYSSLEIILVDDGSKDNSGRICDEYGEQDDRIIVIHQGNKGVSLARNRGLDIRIILKYSLMIWGKVKLIFVFQH